MGTDLRKSGLDIIGDVPWGTHFCQFYRTADDLLDILVPYFAAGLKQNEFCMWVTSEPLGVEAAKAALAAALPDFDAYLEKGQIEILPHSEWYLRDGAFEADRVLAAWVAKLEAARASGFAGLRLTGNTFWLEPKDWRAFTDYEAQIDGVIGKYAMMAVCTYSLDRCGSSEILDVIRNHRFALIRREGKWELVESGEQRRAEDEMRRLAQFPEQNPNAVLRIGLDGVLMYANPTARGLVAALGGPEGGLAPRELRAKMQEAAGRAGTVESELEDGRGRTFWFAAVRPEGEAYVNLYARDITRRKEAEKRSAYGALLLARVHDAVIGADPGMRVSYWNRGAESMFGFTEAEALGRETVGLLQPSYGPGERERIFADLERLGTSQAVIRLTHKDGREIVVEAHSTRLAEAGRTSGYAVVYRDITDRLRAEKALQESNEELEVAAEELRQQNEELMRIQTILQKSEEELRRLAGQRQVALDAARMGWWRYDPLTRQASWDDRYKEIFGIEGHEGSNDEILAGIVHPEDRAELWAKVEAALNPARPKPYAAEYRIIRPDGPTRWIEAHGLASFETSGGERRAVSLVGTVADITDRKRAEESLRRSERLEREQAGQLRAMNEELLRFNRAMVGRETRMIELKKEVNALARRLGEAGKYRVPSEGGE